MSTDIPTVEVDTLLDGEVSNAPVKRLEGDFNRINTGSSDVHVLAKYSKTDRDYLLNYLKSMRSPFPDSITVVIPHDKKRDALTLVRKKFYHNKIDPLAFDWGDLYYMNETLNKIIEYLKKDEELPPNGVIVLCIHTGWDNNNIYILVPEKPIKDLFCRYGEHFFMGILENL